MVAEAQVETVHVSHYWPPLGGANCARFVDGVCRSKMASGEPWEAWIDRAVACPAEWPFGTRIMFEDQEYVCLDRGGAIVYGSDGIAWIDLLTEHAPVPYGALAEVRISQP